MSQIAFPGNIGKVHGLQFSQDGKARFTFSVAESHSRFDKSTNAYKDTGTTWRRVTVFGKRAETLADVIQEGAKQQVVVIGREETRDWQKDDGSKGSSLEVVADVVGIIPSPTQQAPATQQQQGWGQEPAGWPETNTPPF